jgi:hypothetical protein
LIDSHLYSGFPVPSCLFSGFIPAIGGQCAIGGVLLFLALPSLSVFSHQTVKGSQRSKSANLSI